MIKITPLSRQTEVSISRTIGGDYAKIIRELLKKDGVYANAYHFEDDNFTSFYRVDCRLRQRQRYNLEKGLCKIANIPCLNQMAPQSRKRYHVRSEISSSICGFVGNLLFGEYEYLYS